MKETSFRLLTRAGARLSIMTSADTRFRHPDVENPTLADFAAGDYVVVMGPERSGKLDARLVALAPAQGRLVRGHVDSIEGTTLTLTTFNGQEVTIMTGADTRFRIGRDRAAALSDFAAGDQVVVLGRVNDQEATLTALLVARRSP